MSSRPDRAEAHRARRASSHAVIAVRGMPGAKSRLASRLDVEQRRGLVTSMLSDMLAALRGVEGLTTWVMTQSRDVADLAKQAGVGVAADRGRGNLNQAFARVRDDIARRYPDADMIALPGDLPLLSAPDMQALLAMKETADVVIAPAFSDGGTNAVALPVRSPMTFHFGPESFSAHLASAAINGLSTATVERPGFGIDVDDCADLTAIEAQPIGGATRAWFHSLKVST